MQPIRASSPTSPDIRAWGVVLDDMLARRHSLENLTVVTGFENKRNGKTVFERRKLLLAKTASLTLHDSFKDLGRWTPTQIDSRTELLAKVAFKHWPKYG